MTSKRLKSSNKIDHLLSIKALTNDFISSILSKASEMKSIVESKGGDDRLKHKVLASVFYEPSTRTSCSFQAAMLRLGGSVISINDSHSSIKKGETLEDTIQTVSCYCDIIVLRHPVKGSAHTAANVAAIPVINAGDGIGEHPTQALLDLYTIQSELGLSSSPFVPTNIVVAFLGDLKNGRTVHSLVYLLARIPGIRIVYCSPDEVSLPQEIFQEINDQGILQEVKSINEAIATADVLYVTRIQKERFSNEEEYEKLKGSYCINAEIMKSAKPDIVVMHPLPRNEEINIDFDEDPRAAYFRQ